MLLDFSEMGEVAVPNMNGGEGEVRARMYANGWGKAMLATIAPGCSIGSHVQATSVDVNYVVRGFGVATCDGVREELRPGTCHICPQGFAHSIANTGVEDLVLFTLVAEQSGEGA